RQRSAPKRPPPLLLRLMTTLGSSTVVDCFRPRSPLEHQFAIHTSVTPLGHAPTELVRQPRIVAFNVDGFGAALDRETLGLGQRGRLRVIRDEPVTWIVPHRADAQAPRPRSRTGNRLAASRGRCTPPTTSSCRGFRPTAALR